jgi:RNA polymerase sigma-70 factor, ECF subfamily
MTERLARPKSLVATEDREVSSAPPTAPPPSFAAIYRDELPYVWKTLHRLGIPARDVEDLVHEVFLVVHRHLSRYDPARPLRPWLFGIAVRVVSTFRQASRNVREVPSEIGEQPDPAPPSDERLAAAEARALLLEALDTLDLDRRAVFVMHDLDEVAMPEIAAALDIPLNTAYSRLRLARAHLAACARRLRAEMQRRQEHHG